MHSFPAMNTTFFSFGLDRKYQIQYESWVHHVESAVSRFLPDSELSRMNEERGKIIFPSGLLMELLSESLRYYEETDRLFTPFLQQTMLDIGYDQSFENLVPAGNTEAEAYARYKKKKEHIAACPLTLNPIMKSALLAPDASLDFGGIAKGWTAQKMKKWLIEDGIPSGLLDAGGDLAIWGNQESGDPWCIGLADPFQPEEDLGTYTLQIDCGVATSSSLKRRWTNKTGDIAHHIVDPRTQWSSQSDYVQVTVFAPDLTTAEVYAKCLLILGSQSGPDWVQQKRPEIAWVAVRKDKSIDIHPRLDNYCSEWELNKSCQY